VSSDPRERLIVRFDPPLGRGDSWTVRAPSDLRFDREASGGFKTLNCTVTVPAGVPAPTSIAMFAHVTLIDAATGATIWYGDLLDPGHTQDPNSGAFSVTAEGPVNRADGWREVYSLVDRAQESWQGVGDYSGGSGTFTGVFTPPGDYTIDLGAFGDLVDIGINGDLGIDFGGSLELDPNAFGGDINLGTIDFTGVDYPSAAGYPGYLGYLQDPLGGLGDMKAIPLGGTPPGDPFWTVRWVEGATASGGGTTEPSGGYGRISNGSGGRSGRRKTATDPTTDLTSTQFCVGTITGYDVYDPVYSAGSRHGAEFRAKVRFADSTSEAHLWLMADATFSNGFYAALTADGTMTTYLVVSGTATAQDTASGPALTLGATYHFRWQEGSTGGTHVFGVFADGVLTPGSLADDNWVYEGATPGVTLHDLLIEPSGSSSPTAKQFVAYANGTSRWHGLGVGGPAGSYVEWTETVIVPYAYIF
jgi:hypothetical protein